MHLLNVFVKQSRSKKQSFFFTVNLFIINRCNDQIVILTCSGKLGDDEVVCRWKQVQDTVKYELFFSSNNIYYS